MSRWRSLVVIIALTAAALVAGCDLGWEFLKENGGGGNAGAQANCESSRVVTGQFPPSGGLFSNGAFTANYSSPNFNGAVPTKALGLRVSRNRLWLNDFSIEASFFPFDDSERDPRNGCLGRAILEINIPEEDLFFDDRTIEIRSTRVSQTDPSAFYAEGGAPGFTANAVNGTMRLRSIDGSSVEAFFELTFNPGSAQRTFTNGQIDDDIDPNPAAEGL
jgi:hypothetical protein